MSEQKKVFRALLLAFALLTVGLLAAWAVGNADGESAEVSSMKEARVETVEAPASGATNAEASAAPAHKAWDLTRTWNDQVAHWIDFLSGERHDKMKTWLERSGRYAPMIRQELRERGMPQDLLYLALIESGFSPDAYSSADAAGIWQFIASTGRHFGLDITHYLDQRRDPVRSTDAALDYLQQLHDRFGSWYLAAAAYNSGPNRVARVLRQHTGKSHGDDAAFWKIAKYLPRETRNYVPLILAAGYIAKDPAKYGFDDVQYKAPVSYDEVKVPGGTSLSVVAKAAGVDRSAVEALNPQFVRNETPPGRSATWSVRIPHGSQVAFEQDFTRVEQQARASRRIYRVRRGDTLWEIARRHDVSVHQLKRWNNLRGSRILPGQRLEVGS